MLATAANWMIFVIAIGPSVVIIFITTQTAERPSRTQSFCSVSIAHVFHSTLWCGQRWKNMQTLQTRLCYIFPWLCYFFLLCTRKLDKNTSTAMQCNVLKALRYNV